MIEAAIQKTVPSLIEDALRPIYGELHAIHEDLDDFRHRIKDMAATATRPIMPSGASRPSRGISASIS